MKILVTGAGGFIGGYLVGELLAAGYDVVGLDNLSKYGRVSRSHDGNPRYRFVEGDAKDARLLKELLADCDHFIANAAMVGGIAYFHAFPYDLLAENERLTAAAFDAAIWARRNAALRKATVVSSSMVFENTAVFPTPEGEQWRCPPPHSSYGFQKLATERYAEAARRQYGLPYTIVRPFNCVGVGESRSVRDTAAVSGNIKLAMSHVVPDLVQKVLKGQDPLRIFGDGGQVRHYTYAGDVARGIRLSLENPAAADQDFNLSTAVGATVLELAQLIWRKINGDKPFRWIEERPFEHDVRRRIPDVSKARRLLGFEATTPLDVVLDEIIPWVREQIRAGTI